MALQVTGPRTVPSTILTLLLMGSLLSCELKGGKKRDNIRTIIVRDLLLLLCLVAKQKAVRFCRWMAHEQWEDKCAHFIFPCSLGRRWFPPCFFLSLNRTASSSGTAGKVLASYRKTIRHDKQTCGSDESLGKDPGISGTKKKKSNSRRCWDVR